MHDPPLSLSLSHTHMHTHLFQGYAWVARNVTVLQGGPVVGSHGGEDDLGEQACTGVCMGAVENETCRKRGCVGILLLRKQSSSAMPEYFCGNLPPSNTLQGESVQPKQSRGGA